MSFFDPRYEIQGAPTLAGILQDFGNKLQKLLVDNLSNKTASMTSKELEQSIIFDIQLGDGLVEFELKMADYWKFVEHGVQGAGGERKSDSKFSGEKAGSAFINKAPGSKFKFTTKPPPIEAVRMWANSLGINAHAVQKSVFRQGIAPKKFYSEIVNPRLIQDLIKDLEKHAKRAIELELGGAIKGKAS